MKDSRTTSGYDNQHNPLIKKIIAQFTKYLGDLTTKKECISAERKAELIKAAEELFKEKGFENTSVDDIIKRVGVAKGLFYYYFSSKEDMIDILTQRMLNEIESSVVAVIEMKGVSATERFVELLKSQRDVGMRSETVIKYFSVTRNKSLHLELERLAHEILVPAFEVIIKQGIEEGVFDTKYPFETSHMLNMMIHAAMFNLRNDPDLENIKRSLEVVQYLTEKLLGMEPGTFEAYHTFIKTACPELDHILNDE